MKRYNEQTVLRDYICGWYSHLMTDHERLVLQTAGVALKSENVSPRMAAFLSKRLDETGERNPEVMRDLENGVDAFKQRVFNRLTSECIDAIVVNRCSRCNRIVRTPIAEQCLWCGHDWH